MKCPVPKAKADSAASERIKEAFRLQAIAHNVADECVIDENTFAVISGVSGCFFNDGRWIVYDTDERAHVCEIKTFRSELLAFEELAGRLDFQFDISALGEYSKDTPEFAVGDTVRVRIATEKDAPESFHTIEGIVVAHRNGPVRETFTIRHAYHGVSITRTLPLNSPRIDTIKVIRRGKIIRSKLYYLRKRSGVAARIKDKT